MVNPARELAATFDQWSVNQYGGQIPARGGSGAGTVEFWRAQRDAADLVADVESGMNVLALAGHDVTAFQPFVLDWYRAVFAASTQWATVGTASAFIGSEARTALLGLGALFDASPLPSLAPEQRAELLDCIGEALNALEDDSEGLDASEKRYVYELLESIRRLLLERKVLGGSEVLALIDQLNGALIAVASQLTRADGNRRRGKRFTSLVSRIVGVSRGVIQDTAALSSIGVLAIEVVKLTS